MGFGIHKFLRNFLFYAFPAKFLSAENTLWRVWRLHQEFVDLSVRLEVSDAQANGRKNNRMNLGKLLSRVHSSIDEQQFYSGN